MLILYLGMGEVSSARRHREHVPFAKLLHLLCSCHATYLPTYLELLGYLDSRPFLLVVPLIP